MASPSSGLKTFVSSFWFSFRFKIPVSLPELLLLMWCYVNVILYQLIFVCQRPIYITDSVQLHVNKTDSVLDNICFSRSYFMGGGRPYIYIVVWSYFLQEGIILIVETRYWLWKYFKVLFTFKFSPSCCFKIIRIHKN